MSEIGNTITQKRFIESISGSPFARSLFSEVRWAWIWLPIRLYVGWVWLQAGWGKLNNPVWTGSKAGVAISGFVSGALTKTGGEHPDVQGWYAWFLERLVLPNAKFWSYLVTIGEVLVGIALILGIFTSIAAFFGGFMNMNYLLAGTVSTNPILLPLAAILVLAWRTAGWWGLDRWVVPAVGTPWSPGLFFLREGDSRSIEHQPSQP